MDAVDPGVDADARVGGLEERAEHLVDVAFADAGGLEGACDEELAAGKLSQARLDLLLPHALHLRRRSGHGDNDPVVLLDPPTWGCPARVGNGHGGGDEPGLRDVALREANAARGEEGPLRALGVCVHERLLAQGGGDRPAR